MKQGRNYLIPYARTEIDGYVGNQANLPLVGSIQILATRTKRTMDKWTSSQYSKSSRWYVHGWSMYTEAINHGPGVTFMQTGSQFTRLQYGGMAILRIRFNESESSKLCGTENQGKGGQPLVSRLWGSGFLPACWYKVQSGQRCDSIPLVRKVY